MKALYVWIAGIYFMEGLPYALISVVAPVYYKLLGFNNGTIAFATSLFTLPWILKFLVAPALETFTSKRKQCLYTQVCIAILMMIIAASFLLSSSFFLYAILFSCVAIFSAIHDINADGLYIEKLDYASQAKLIGLRTFAYQLGRIMAQSGILFVVGYMTIFFNKNVAWSLSFILTAMLILMLTLVNSLTIPIHSTKGFNQLKPASLSHSYQEVLSQLHTYPYLYTVFIFLFIYNMPVAQLMKIIPLYMLDKIDKGGLNLTVNDVGLMYGGMGLVGMLIGVSLSGYLIHLYSLRKCLLIFTCINLLGNCGYLFLAMSEGTPSYTKICVAIIGSEFGFGISNGAYMFYLINIFAQGTYAMSLYTLGVAIMLFGMLLSGSISGYMQQLLTYKVFFSWILLANICILIFIYKNNNKLIPINNK